ncbi:MAG: AIR synthase related protein [Myxococcota bacterium]|nr:AIR synthase related protein [Myxococcota bacterium]MDW8362519.1 AIR synthase related protein [Myxococcales bacterium]
MSPIDAYAAAGVDYEVVDPVKRLAQRLALGTLHHVAARGGHTADETLGDSAFVFEVGGRWFATVTEALGTKNLVADAVRAYTGRTFYDAIARDTVATVLNDLATVGARPLVLSAYWAAGAPEWFADTARMEDLVRGWAAACEQARCAWAGGETQVLKGIVAPDAAVLGGSATGVIDPPSSRLGGHRLRPGDAILVAPSTGIHANGLTLARRLVEQLPQGYRTPLPDDGSGRTVGEALLDPQPLYGPLLETLLDAGVAVRHAVHITGHGWRKLMRARESFRYVIDRMPPVPPVLRFLADVGRLRPEEAYATFNMGAGFALFVATRDVSRASAVAEGAGRPLLHVGHVETGPRSVVLRPPGIEYGAEALALRTDAP